eukprot:14659213-Ditylum_brightwellii.AAC.1
MVLKTEGKHHGPVMCEEDGTLLSSAKVEDEFHAQIIQVLSTHPHLLPPSIDVAELYGLSRSIRRGSLLHATDQGVPKELWDLQNCWKSIEAKQGSCARSVMRNHYLEVRLLAKQHLGYWLVPREIVAFRAFFPVELT